MVYSYVVSGQTRDCPSRICFSRKDRGKSSRLSASARFQRYDKDSDVGSQKDYKKVMLTTTEEKIN